MKTTIYSHRFHLIQTFTGRTIARAKDPEAFRQVISKKEAGLYTVHDVRKGIFEPATNLFKEVPGEWE
jgi:hypothetical protein